MMSKLKTVLRTLKDDPRPFRRLSCRAISALPFDAGRLLGIKLKIHDYRIFLRQSSLSLALFYDPNCRNTDHEFICSYIAPDDVYIDIGANVGTTLIPAAQIISCGTVMGFEPHPHVFEIMRDNVQLNGLLERVKLHNCAVSNVNGTVSFSSGRQDDTNRVTGDAHSSLKVPATPLDDFTDRLPQISLIKIDVEGYEKYVLEGAERTLLKTRCIYIEVSEEHFSTFGYSVRDVLSKLANLGFGLYIKSGERKISQIDCSFKLTTHHTNVIALRDCADFLERTGWTLESNVAESANRA